MTVLEQVFDYKLLYVVQNEPACQPTMLALRFHRREYNNGDGYYVTLRNLKIQRSPNIESINDDNTPLGKDLWIFIRDTNITSSDMDELKNLCWKLGIKICSSKTNWD